MAHSTATYFSKKVIALNVVATVLIVLLHSETPVRWGQLLDIRTYPFIWIVYTLSQVAVPLFFFISALLFYRNCEWRNIPMKLYRRIFSLLIPFIIWNVFFVAVYWALQRIPLTASRMAISAPLDTTRQWIVAIWHTQFTPLWFVKYLIFFCLMSPALLLVIKNKWIGITVTASVFVLSVVFKWDGMSSLLYWLPVYLAGALTGRYLHGSGKDENVRLFCGIKSAARITIAIGMIILLMVIYVWGVLDEGSWIYGRFIGPIAIWFLTDLMLPADFKDTFKVRDWMGYTFFIYATHHFLLNVEQTLVRSFLPSTPFVLNLTFIVTPIVTLLIIIWAARLLSRFKFYKVLTGGR